MEVFDQVRTVRLRSHHDKYLVAENDGEHVIQERDGSGREALWTVERFEDNPNALRLRSWASGRYLTAADESYLLGVTGKKVRLTLPPRLDSSLEWEPVREGKQVKFKTRYGNYLRGNAGLPPWRNSVTHDVPHRSSHQDWILWDIEIVERMASSPGLSKVASSVSSSSASLHKVEDRSIYYAVADDYGDVDENVEWSHLTFNGTCVEELTKILKEDTKLEDIFVCTRNPLNHQLTPLRLHLPPNNTTMRLVVVQANSKVSKKFIF